MITVLFLYRPVAWCFLRVMKSLSISMVGVALLVGGCGDTGTKVEYNEDGSKEWEIPHVDGKIHGTLIYYRENGSKKSEIPYVDDKPHGTQFVYKEDGSKWTEMVWEHGNFISTKDF